MVQQRWWNLMKVSFLPRLYFRQDKVARLRRYVRALLYCFNLHTLMLMTLACISVYICDRYRFSYNMDLTLVATGVTFPLIFNIQQAFTRREKALTLIANLKASAVALYFMHRDWAQDEGFPTSLGNDHTAAALHCKLLLMDLLRDVRKYLVAHSPWESYAEQRLAAKHHPYVNMLLADMSLSGASQMSFAAAIESSSKQDPATSALRRCYRGFSRLSVLNERLGLRSGYTKGGEGGMSRTNQYLRYMMANLEELRMIREYRTPIMMRYANGVLLHIFAITLAPYFCHFCDSWTAMGYSRSSCPAGYSAAIVFTVIVMLLYNVQQDIEQPFDMAGLDDVFFDVGDEVFDEVMEPVAGTAAPSGFTTPRHIPESYCSSSMCPASPNVRCPAELQGQHPPPWGLAAAAARITPQASLLKPVTEGKEGFEAAGFGSISLAVHRNNSTEALGTEGQSSCLGKQQQQQHEKHLNCGAAAGPASPHRAGSPPALSAREYVCVEEPGRGAAGVLSNSSSRERLDGVHIAAAGLRRTSTSRESTSREIGAAVELSHRSNSAATGWHPASGQEGRAPASSRRTSDRGSANGAIAVTSTGAGGREGAAADKPVIRRSSSSNESARLIKTGVYSSPEW